MPPKKTKKSTTTQNSLNSQTLSPSSQQFSTYETETYEMDLMLPASFCGSQNSDPKTWLNDFNLYCQLKGLKEDGRIALFLLSMKDVAHTWVMTVNEDDKKKFETLTTAFTARFSPVDSGTPDKMKALWTTCQGTSEPVRNFIDRMIALSAGLELTETVLLSAIQAGLKPSVRQFVTRQQPKTMKILMESAMLAEQTEFSSEATIPDALSRTLQRLEDKLDNTHLAAISSRPHQSSRSDETYNVETTSPSRNIRTADFDEPSRNFRYGRSPSVHQPPSSDHRKFRSPSPSSNHYRRSPSAERRQQRSNFDYQPSWNQENMQGSDYSYFCFRCLGTNHSEFSCRHIYTRCRFCHNIGHVIRACRKRQSKIEGQ